MGLGEWSRVRAWGVASRFWLAGCPSTSGGGCTSDPPRLDVQPPPFAQDERGRGEVVRIVVRWVRANGGRWLLGVFGWMGLAGDGEAEVESVEDAEEGVDAGIAFAGEGAVEGLAS